MAYTVYQPPDSHRDKEVRWDCDPMSENDHPTLEDVVETANKEFPGVSFKQLIITASGYDAEIIWLKPRKI